MAHATTNEMNEPRFSQSRLESAVEQGVNTISGFVLAWLAWQFLIPVLVPGIQPSSGQSWTIIIVFTVISIVRGYFWRRFFENGIHRLIHCMLGGKNERE